MNNQASIVAGIYFILESLRKVVQFLWLDISLQNFFFFSIFSCVKLTLSGLSGLLEEAIRYIVIRALE